MNEPVEQPANKWDGSAWFASVTRLLTQPTTEEIETLAERRWNAICKEDVIVTTWAQLSEWERDLCRSRIRGTMAAIVELAIENARHDLGQQA